MNRTFRFVRSVVCSFSAGGLACAALASDALTIDMIRSAESHTNAGFEALENYLYWAGKKPELNAEIYAKTLCSELRTAEFMLDMARMSMSVGGPNEIGPDSEVYLHALSQAEELSNRFPCPEQGARQDETGAQ